MKRIYNWKTLTTSNRARMGVHVLMLPLLLFALLSSCSDSNVPCEDVRIPVHLTIHHDLEWTDTVYYPQGYFARAGRKAPACRVRYEIRAYPKGVVSGQCRRFSFYSDDVSLADFQTDIQLPMGDWDVYAWQDLVTEGQEPYYDINDFAAITYTKPYRGDTDHRDCFRGAVNVSVPPSALGSGSVSGRLDLARPTGKYVFIATDYNEFLEKYATRGPEKYTVCRVNRQVQN